ncbi:MAG: N-acetylmuramoyl-L-alanine amidase [Candidatus Omnitrophota bacterium]|nr:MAG: N-acetylmuramoyl-L-alanine amidase [Candidatus Omnitrophota bacterium]
MKKIAQFAVIVGLATVMGSCTTARLQSTYYPAKEMILEPSTSFVRRDIVHTVAPGETLWRIGKMYDVGVRDIMRANRLRKPKSLRMGQCLYIPQAAPLRAVVPLYPSSKWRYIIVHHSATGEGNALTFHNSHRLKGWESVGYHFIITNGTKGKSDGHIEATPRWIKQQNGAHCKAADMNGKSIGICLVGDFSRERVSKKQMESLVHLVHLLRKHYNIPLYRVMGHGDVPGAITECPGKYFPWGKLQERLIVVDRARKRTFGRFSE